MATVPKIGGNQYFATSKNINKMINQLNSVLVSSNITTAPAVTLGASNTATIDLSKGNFITITLSTNTSNGISTLSLINPTVGIYYLKIKNGQSSTSSSIVITNGYPSGNQVTTNSGINGIDLFTIMYDGTNFYTISKYNLA